MIVERTRSEKFTDAIALAESTPANFSRAGKLEGSVQLLLLALRTGEVARAQTLFSQFKSAYPDEDIYIEMFQDMFKHLDQDLKGGAVSLESGTGLQLVKSNENATESVNSTEQTVPTSFAMAQNYPNPFNPTTNIRYDLPLNSFVTLAVYNLRGQKIRTLFEGTQEAGFKTSQWDGRNDSGELTASGVYFLRLEAKAVEDFSPQESRRFVKTEKMVFVK